MKHYELTYIISSEIASEEAEAYAQNIDSFIQNKSIDVNALITHEYDLSEIEQAYQILSKGQALGLIFIYDVEQKKVDGDIGDVFNQSAIDRKSVV